MAAQIPRCQAEMTELRDTRKRQMFSLCLQRGSHDVLLTNRIYKNKWLIFNAWLKPHPGTERGCSQQSSLKSRSRHTDVSPKFLRMSLTYWNDADAYNTPPPKLVTEREEWSLWRTKLLWICTSVCPSKCLCVPCPPPMIVLRQRVSSPAYPSVLYSRPPLRQRTRVYYSLQ